MLLPWTMGHWDTGYLDNRGYFRVYRPDYPRAYGSGYTKRYYIVWWLNTGEVIDTPRYIIHHKNGNKSDDRFDNLEKKEHGQHTLDHNKPRMEAARTECICNTCGVLFHIKRHRLKEKGRGSYCSQQCYKIKRLLGGIKDEAHTLHRSSRVHF